MGLICEEGLCLKGHKTVGKAKEFKGSLLYIMETMVNTKQLYS